MHSAKRRLPFRAIPLLLLSALTVAGCAKSDAGDAPSPAAPVTHISSDGTVPTATWEVSDVDLHMASRLAGDTLYYMTGKWDSEENGYTEAAIWRKIKNDNAESIVRLDAAGEKLILYLLDAEENLYYLHTVTDAGETAYLWTKRSPEGSILYETTLSCSGDAGEQEAFQRLSAAFTGEVVNGEAAIANLDGDLYLLDAEGRLAATGSAGWTQDAYSVLEYGLVSAGEGGIYSYHIDGPTIVLQQVDMSNGTLRNPTEIDLVSQNSFTLELYSAHDRGIYILNDSRLWLYNPLTNELSDVLNWSDSNVNLSGYNIDALGLLPEDRICLMLHRMDEKASFVQISFRDQTELPEKQVVTLSVSQWEEALLKMVSAFNRQSDEYQIELQMLEELDDYTSLELALLRGEGPDLFSMRNQDIPNLAYKGVLEDLSPYFAESSLVSEEDILPSILDTWIVAEKLCIIFPDFGIEGFLVQKGTTDQGIWTPEDYIALGEANPDSILTRDDPQYYRSQVFFQAIQADIPDYVDWQAGECHFDSERFISLIERTGNFKNPEMTTEQLTTTDGKTHTIKVSLIEQDEDAFYKGLLLTKRFILYSLPQYADILEQSDFAEIAGYPNSRGELYFDLYADNSLSMNSASTVKDGAWAFMEFCLSEPYQNTQSSFPVRQDSFEKYLTRKEFYNGWVTVSLTEEEKDLLRNMAAHIHWTSPYTGYNVLPFVSEEVSAVWAGDKSAEDAAAIIQNRVSLFLSEQGGK